MTPQSGSALNNHHTEHYGGFIHSKMLLMDSNTTSVRLTYYLRMFGHPHMHIFVQGSDQRVGEPGGAHGVHAEVCADTAGCSTCTLQHCIGAGTAV